MIHLVFGARSHVGQLRTKNEDCALVSERVVAIADGMGGPPGGDVASLVAVEALRAAITDPQIDTLADAFQWANAQVWERAADRDLRGMGTTMAALALVHDGADGEPPRLAIANVGDSRIYLLRDGELELRTQDHSLVEEMVRDGRLTAEEAQAHGQRNIVTRAIGIGPTVEVDSWEFEPDTGDRYLLCSDGLFNEVDPQRIAATLRRLADPDEAASELVALANQAGGRDNITCVVVDIVDGAPAGRGAGSFGDRVLVPRADAVQDLAGFQSASGDAGTDDEYYDREAIWESDPDDRDRSMLPATEAADRDRRPRLVTWRAGLFVLAIIAVFAVAAAAVVWYGRGGYFIDIDESGEVAVFQGRPGGILWFDPTFVESTGVDADDLTPVLRSSVEERPQFATFDDARRYLANLAEQLDRARPAPTTTTTTTTTTEAATDTEAAPSPAAP
jgi:PPM family protein phosphatase